jgi:TonB family protein
MNTLFSYLLEGSIILSIFYLFYWLFLSKLTFFEWNRYYILLTLLLTLSIPLIQFEINFLPQTSTGGEIYFAALPEFEINNTASSPITYGIYLLLGVYLIGVAKQLLVLISGIAYLLVQLKKSERIRKDGYTIIVNPKFEPSSFFHFILLPAYDSADRKQQLILLHEYSHARQLHSFDVLLLQVVRIVLWFHPLIRPLEAQLHEVHEYQADQEVTVVHPKKEYAQLLLNLVLGQQRSLPVNSFNQFQLKNRIIMMHKNPSPNQQKVRFLFAIPIVLLTLAVFSCENEINESVKEVDFGVTEDIPLENSPGDNLRILSADEVFDVVEDAPQFPGGMEAWSAFLASNLKYPEQAKKAGIEGTVFLVFEVDREGKVKNPEILRGIGAGCDEEALRVIRESPDWLPGLQKGRKVNVRMRLPIRFKLD